MHSQGQHKGLRSETSVEERRNHILRVRYGEITSTGKPIKSERRKPKIRYGTKALNDFVIVGQTVSTYMRLPQLCNEVPYHKRSSTAGRNERLEELAVVRNLASAVGDSHTERVRGGSLKNFPTNRQNDRSSANPSIPVTRSIEVRIPQTAPAERLARPQRRWSDGGSSFSESLSESFQPIHQSLAKSLTLSSRSLNIVQSDPCVTQSPEEIINEFREYSKQKDMQSDEVSVRSLRVLRKLGTPRHENSQISKSFFQKPSARPSAKDLSQKPKRQRRRNTKPSVPKQKRRSLMVPSGDSLRTKGTSQDKLPNSSNNATVSTLSFRKGSRLIPPNRDGIFHRKFEANAKAHKKELLSRLEAPSVPSEEEIKEIQELPIIRKFLRMPKSRPKLVCFDYPGVDLTHMDVKKAIDRAVPGAFETGKVISMQFENVNVKLATGGLDNRWLIELQDFATRNKLIKHGLVIDRPDRNSITDLKLHVPKWMQDHGTDSEDEKDDVEILFPPIHYPNTVQVKLNDAVSMEEYKLYLRRTAATEKLQNVALLCAGRGDKLLTTMI